MQKSTIAKLAYSVREAAEALSVSVPYIRLKIREFEQTGRGLKPTRLGARVLIKTEDLENFLNGGRRDV